jgi:hypothetical protein
MKIDITVTLDDGTVLQLEENKVGCSCTRCYYDRAGDCAAPETIPPCTVCAPGGHIFFDGHYVRVGGNPVRPRGSRCPACGLAGVAHDTPNPIPAPQRQYHEPDAVDVVGMLTISL